MTLRVRLGLAAGVAVALAVIAVAFQPRTEHVHHRIDYLGAAVLTAGLSAIVLFTSLGGTSYSWGSPFMIALIVIGVAMLILFPFVEHRASEPILPNALFRNRIFVVASAVGILSGMTSCAEPRLGAPGVYAA